MKEKLRETFALEDKVIKLEGDLENTREQLEKSEIEKKEVNKYALELVEKFKKEAEA